MILTQEQIEVLLHTSRTGRYVTGELLVIQMAQSGLLKDHGPQALAGGDHYFTMTVRGTAEVRAYNDSLPKPKPLTRSQRRYRQYLHSDGWDNFKHFLGALSEGNRRRREGLSVGCWPTDE